MNKDIIKETIKKYGLTNGTGWASEGLDIKIKQAIAKELNKVNDLEDLDVFRDRLGLEDEE